MSAKVYKRKDGSWWLRTHHAGKKSEKRFGPAKKDKARADKVAEKINAMIAIGTFDPSDAQREQPIPCDAALDRWLAIHNSGLKRTTALLYQGIAKNHLKPHFGSKDMRTIDNEAVLSFVDSMTKKGRAPGTIKNALAFLRQVFNALIEEEKLKRNPLSNMGRLMRRVRSASDTEVKIREAWTRSEAATLLEISWAHEPRFAPLLELMFATGVRRGEALGLKWEDVDFDNEKILIRRSISTQGQSTPKSGKARRVVMTSRLADQLFDLLALRQQGRISNGWAETPDWVFCSEIGTAPIARNVARVWERVRRRAVASGVRKLTLHSARHSWATWALQAGKNIKWVADQLGHADPSTTLKHYAHAMPEDDTDLSFLDLDVTKRHQASPPVEVGAFEASKYAESWCAGRESNPRPSGSKPDALSS